MEIEAMEITASDGERIEANECGKGEIGLVLAHGMHYPDGKDSFREETLFFAREGMRVLAISFRGYPASSAPPVQEGRDLDILAAVTCLAERGCKRIFVLGSSMGGWATLKAGEALAKIEQLSGIILLSAGDPHGADHLKFPKLLIVARDDTLVYDRVVEMYKSAPEPKRLVEFEAGGHGSR